MKDTEKEKDDRTYEVHKITPIGMPLKDWIKIIKHFRKKRENDKN